MSWKIGVDIGGTFTDFAIRGEAGTFLWKESSTPARPEDAIRTGLANAARELEVSLEDLLATAELFVHGSTIAVNAILQRSGPLVGLVCTKGFRDVLYLRDGFKPARYDPRLQHPGAFVDRYLRLGVGERLDARGDVVTPLDDHSVRQVAATFREQGVESIAVALMWAHVNPAHERRVRDVLLEELPDVPVLLSSDILAETGEWVRTSSTAISAYVLPGSRRYLGQLEDALREDGLRAPLQIMQLNGGCSTVEHTLRYPVNTIGSGPAAAPAAALRAASRVSARDVIVVDMGGTSFDVCLVQDQRLPMSRALSVVDQPLGVAGVEIHSIGAGGGSIAWIDSGGALRVGPRSAGAQPGPVAYGAGGTEPTVTDANVVLGYLSPENFLGGRRGLDRAAAEAAIEEKIAAPLGIGTVEAAAGIVRVVNASMVNAIGVVSVQRGIDPQPYVLVAGGGAGALHTGRLAAELGMSRVLVPAEAGTISAFGMTSADVRHDYLQPLFMTSEDPRVDGLRELLEAVERDARDALLAEGFSADQIVLERSVDARYHGQVHELIAPVPDATIDEQTIALVAQGFHDLHAERYGWKREDYPVEFLHWRVSARGLFGHDAEPMFDVATEERPPSPPAHERDAYFDEYGDFVSTPAYWAHELTAGVVVEGPALIDGSTTTLVVFPEQRLLADGRGNFVVELEGKG